MPRCSIVIPVYNVAPFLDTAMQSVFGQSMVDFELIVINDGSTDETANILQRYQTDPRLSVLTNAVNSGIVYSLNRGVAAAQTDLIVRFDGDDIMKPNRLERQLDFMGRNPGIGGAGSYWHVIDEQGRDCGTFEWPISTIEKMNRYIDNGGNPVYPHPGMILRKSAIQAVGGYREEYRRCEDVDLFLRMISAGYPLLIQPEYLFCFRTHPQSTSANNGRYQEELNEILFANFRRRRRGLPDIPLDEFRQQIASHSILKRLWRESLFASRWCMRRRTEAQIQNKTILATALLFAAAACNPSGIVSKLRRIVSLR